jgi:hypothetical protein
VSVTRDDPRTTPLSGSDVVENDRARRGGGTHGREREPGVVRLRLGDEEGGADRVRIDARGERARLRGSDGPRARAKRSEHGVKRERDAHRGCPQPVAALDEKEERQRPDEMGCDPRRDPNLLVAQPPHQAKVARA